MKRHLCILLSFFLIFTFVSCGSVKEDELIGKESDKCDHTWDEQILSKGTDISGEVTGYEYKVICSKCGIGINEVETAKISTLSGAPATDGFIKDGEKYYEVAGLAVQLEQNYDNKVLKSSVYIDAVPIIACYLTDDYEVTKTDNSLTEGELCTSYVGNFCSRTIADEVIYTAEHYGEGTVSIETEIFEEQLTLSFKAGSQILKISYNGNTVIIPKCFYGFTADDKSVWDPYSLAMKSNITYMCDGIEYSNANEFPGISIDDLEIVLNKLGFDCSISVEPIDENRGALVISR